MLQAVYAMTFFSHAQLSVSGKEGIVRLHLKDRCVLFEAGVCNYI